MAAEVRAEASAPASAPADHAKPFPVAALRNLRQALAEALEETTP
jgi:hypothetical protein